jgi:hypothetical protein
MLRFEILNENGYFARIKIDDEDLVILQQHNWLFNKSTKAVFRLDGRTRISLANDLLHIDYRIIVDHINGSRFDFRKENLRFCTPRENSTNKRKTFSKTSSKYKGVFWENSCNRWRAQISLFGKNKHIGVFVNEKEAALAYDRAARENYGEFACVNFINNPKERKAI